MIKALTVKNYRGESLTMTLANPRETGLLICKIDGLGAPDAEIHISDLATMDGGLFTNAKADPREIEIEIAPLMKSNVEQSRHRIYRYFPIKQKLTLTFHTTERESTIEGYVSKIEPDIFSKDERVKISIHCPNPYFHDTQDMLTHVFAGSEPLFEFPFSNNLDHFPVHSYHTYEYQSVYTQLVREEDLYLILPDGLGDIQFRVPGTTVTNGTFRGTIRVHTIDGAIVDGTITLISNTTEQVAIAPRTTATQLAFAYNPQTGYEYWSAVIVSPRAVLAANAEYHILIPDRGHYHFTNEHAVSNQTSFEISLRLAAGVIYPDEVSIDQYLYKAKEGNSGADIFDGDYTIELKYFEYADAETSITKTGEETPDTHTDTHEIVMSEVRRESEHTFDYEGDAETGMLMIMQANKSVGLVTIYDLTSGEYFTIDTSKIAAITGTAFQKGDQIVVSTESGNKYVRLLRNGVYTNVINSLDRGSTWFTLKPGVNTFAYIVDTGIDSLDFKISYNIAYQGV